MAAARRLPRALNLKAPVSWPEETALAGLTFKLKAMESSQLYPQYTVGLHAWFLDQMRQFDPDLSAYMHDEEAEKPFTLSPLDGPFQRDSQELQLQAGKIYTWQLTSLTPRVVQGLATWLNQLPTQVGLRQAPLAIESVHVSQVLTTYEQLWAQGQTTPSFSLSFMSPTSFRRKGHHLPLPWPTNVFHSYLRRWNNFADRSFDQEAFLAWVDEAVIIQRHRLESMKVVAGKRGSVTGFMGAITYGLSHRAKDQVEFRQLFGALGLLAPYCGTGHKTTFGLGQTQLDWHVPTADETTMPSKQTLLAERIAELTDFFKGQKKRTGGQRAQKTGEMWATILARRELGDSLQAIATDLDIPYETAKTYSKLARRALAGRAKNEE